MGEEHGGALGKERVEKRLQELMESGVQDKVYEALQLYTSKASRKSSVGDYDGAIKIASEGGVALVEHGAAEGGLQLANFIIKMAGDHETTFGETRDALLRIDSALASGGHAAQRTKLLKSALTWSSKKGDRLYGDKTLNLVYGELLWDSGELDKAMGRLVCAEAPSLLCTKILESFSSPEGDETAEETAGARSRFAALGVLSFLAIENLRDANGLFDEMSAAIAEKELPAGQNELWPFVKYLLKTCERDAQALFQLLCQMFQSAIDDEPTAKQLLAEIGERYFRVPKPPSLFAMMQNMMGMFG